MVIIMFPEATEEEIAVVEKRLADSPANLHIQRTDGETLTIIAAIGDTSAVDSMRLESLSGVDRVVPISKPYKLASNEVKHHEPSVYEIEGTKIGGNHFCLIAGPCTVEDHDTAVRDAMICAEGGASMLRAGIFKPRTSTFAFQGPGTDGFRTLVEMKERTGLPVVSELTSSQYAEELAEVVDVIQIGARNMQNYKLLEIVGKLGKPVLLKRGLASTLDEFLQAADYILKNQEEVILCERGIRTFETATRFTLDVGVVPYLKLHTHLPIVIDPSHASGDRKIVPAVSRAAAAVGADGIIVETTENPENAKCDGPQQLFTSDFKEFADEVYGHAELLGKNPS